MHFVGMLALHSKMPFTFLLVSSILPGLAAVALVYPALRILHSGALSLSRLALAGAGEKHQRLAFNLGATDYFTKPVNEALLRRVGSLVGAGR